MVNDTRTLGKDGLVDVEGTPHLAECIVAQERDLPPALRRSTCDCGSVPTSPPWSKRCTCGVVYDRAGWNALDLVGYQLGPSRDEYEPSIWELRNCPCASTLNVDVPVEVALHTIKHVRTTRLHASAVRSVIELLTEQRDLAAKRARDASRREVAARTRCVELERQLSSLTTLKQPRAREVRRG